MDDDLAPDRFSSALAERLLRRATEPVGVIDVRGPQERYARATSWPRRHVSLLDRWVSRYGQEAQPDRGAELLFAARHVGAVTPAIDGPLPARASVPARSSSSGESPSLPDVGTTRPDAGSQDANHHREVHVGPAMRAVPMARARSPLASRSTSATADVPVAVAHSTSDSGSGWRSDSVRREGLVASAMRAVRVSETTTLPLVARATSSAAPVDVQPADAGVSAPIVSDATARDGSPDARIAVDASVVPASPDARQRRSTATATAHATSHATSNRASEIARPVVPSSSVLVQRRPAVPEVRTARPVAVPTLIASTSARPRAPIGTAVPAIATPVLEHTVVTVFPSSTPDGSTATSSSHADERARTLGADQIHGADQTQGAPRTDIVRTPARARSPANAQPLASAQPLVLSHPARPVIQRFTAGDPPSSEIVWRKAGATGSGGAAPPSTIARASAPGSDGGSTTSTSVAAPEAIGTGRRGPDTAQLMEQVTRRLLRQIAVERERRGGSRWP